MKVDAHLAFRLLAGHNRKHLLASGWFYAFFGIFLASLFVLVTLGILSGYQGAYRSAIMRFNAHVILSSETGLGEADRREVESVLNGLLQEFSHHKTPYVYHETLVPVAQAFKPVILKGVDFEHLNRVYPFVPDLKGKTDRRDAILMGKNLAEETGVLKKNQGLRYLGFEKKRPASQTGTTRFKTLPVAGIFESGLYHYDGQYVLMDARELMRRLGTERVHGYEIRLKDPSQTHDMVRVLKQKFTSRFVVTSWDELNADLFSALKLERTVIFIIVILILIVACLNVFGFNFLFFVGRMREFRVLWLIGLSRARILGLIRRLGLFLGFLATLLASLLAAGCLLYLRDGLGIRLDPQVYYVDRVPVHFEWVWFGIFLGVTWLLCDFTSFVAGHVMVRRHLGQRV